MPVLSKCRSQEQIRVEGGVETERSGGLDFFNDGGRDRAGVIATPNTTRYGISTKISTPYDPNSPKSQQVQTIPK
ncbi:hypothetical protein ACN38_g5949 [Penicillium nordicum]|uniref:Uncharacterized protein n=1 Tax=Penicillium nordicum TaxID=229535 RepID=A0A0M9WFQ6_9EURO|nr:hypothetical protein ACN38_g5949 [Penicillium nordicum]